MPSLPVGAIGDTIDIARSFEYSHCQPPRIAIRAAVRMGNLEGTCGDRADITSQRLWPRASSAIAEEGILVARSPVLNGAAVHASILIIARIGKFSPQSHMHKLGARKL